MAVPTTAEEAVRLLEEDIATTTIPTIEGVEEFIHVAEVRAAVLRVDAGNIEDATARRHFRHIQRAEQRVADAEQARADAEQARADAEQARADAEQRVADAEQRVADAEQRAADAEAEREQGGEPVARVERVVRIVNPTVLDLHDFFRRNTAGNNMIDLEGLPLVFEEPDGLIMALPSRRHAFHAESARQVWQFFRPTTDVTVEMEYARLFAPLHMEVGRGVGDVGTMRSGGQINATLIDEALVESDPYHIHMVPDNCIVLGAHFPLTPEQAVPIFTGEIKPRDARRDDWVKVKLETVEVASTMYHAYVRWFGEQGVEPTAFGFFLDFAGDIMRLRVACVRWTDADTARLREDTILLSDEAGLRDALALSYGIGSHVREFWSQRDGDDNTIMAHIATLCDMGPRRHGLVSYSETSAPPPPPNDDRRHGHGLRGMAAEASLALHGITLSPFDDPARKHIWLDGIPEAEQHRLDAATKSALFARAGMWRGKRVFVKMLLLEEHQSVTELRVLHAAHDLPRVITPLEMVLVPDARVLALVLPRVQLLRDAAHVQRGDVECFKAVLLECARAMVELRSVGWTHGDIKPENIGVEESGRVVLFDFGLARPTGTTRATSGTEGFRAPERRSGEPHDAVAADVYSLAMTMREIMRPNDVIPTTRRTRTLPALQLGELLGKMGAPDVGERMSLDDVVEALCAQSPTRPCAKKPTVG